MQTKEPICIAGKKYIFSGTGENQQESAAIAAPVAASWSGTHLESSAVDVGVEGKELNIRQAVACPYAKAGVSRHDGVCCSAVSR